MLRMLKAFAWMRWRMLANALEHSGSRDTLERFSIAVENLGPIIAAVLLIPSALFLTGLGIAGGYTLAGSARSLPFEVARYLLLLVPLLVVVGPLLMPGADRTNPVRLLLLPIPRTTLYIAQSSAAFGDPWTMLMVPLVLGVPIGLAAGGAMGAALVALAAAILLILAIVGLSSLATSMLHIVARDRRRGELLALVFIIVLPVVGMLPGLMSGSSRRGGEPRESLLPGWVSTAGTQALALHPGEMFTEGTRAAATGRLASAGASLTGLAVLTLVLHGLGVIAFRKVLDSPASSGARRAGAMHAAWGSRIPGLTTGASAVALGHFRLALRTPRGRSMLLSPLVMLVVFGVMIYRGSGTMDFGPFHFDGGLSLATFISSVSLLAILPIAMNQFAVDGAGLTMTLLSPLSDKELLAGKAAGNGMIALVPLLISIGAPLLLFRSGSPALWLSLPLGLLSVYFVVAPLAAMCSAIFPRKVDMNSIGRGSNAHGASGLLGLLGFVGAAVPPVVLVLLATRFLQRPLLAPVLLAGWCVVAYVIGHVLFIAARRTFAARRENLAMLV